MKIHTFFLITHGLAAAASAASTVAASASGSSLYLAVALAFSLVAVVVTSWYAANRTRTGLRAIESVVTDHENTATLHTSLSEFDLAAQRVGQCSARWESVAAETRRQTRDVRSMMSLLNRRGAKDSPSSEQLRDMLAALGNNLHSQLSKIEQGASDIEAQAKAITSGVEAQGHAVIKTTTSIEQLSATIDSVTLSTSAALSATERKNDLTLSTLDQVRELIDGLTHVRSESHTCEKKLRGLCDPTQQITAIVDTIRDITARTDLLALNASIESIRAGEHGRGFAIVADEVRKLNEQASGATREISSLLDSMQLVTQESIRGIEHQREQVDKELDRAVAAKQSLQKVCDPSMDDSSHLRCIAEASTQQLKLAQGIVTAVETISEIAMTSRGGAESVCWTVKSLSKLDPQFRSTVDRLRGCGDTSDRDDTIVRGEPVAFPASVADMAHVG